MTTTTSAEHMTSKNMGDLRYAKPLAMKGLVRAARARGRRRAGFSRWERGQDRAAVLGVEVLVRFIGLELQVRAGA